VTPTSRLVRCLLAALASVCIAGPFARAGLVGDVGGRLVPLGQATVDESLQEAPDWFATYGVIQGNFVADPFRSDTYWAASFGSGIWKTTDGGRTWVPKNQGLERLLVAFVPGGSGGPGPLLRRSPRFRPHVALDRQRRELAAGRVCEGPWPLTGWWTDLSISRHPASPPLKTLWGVKQGIQSGCGHLFRSDDQGESWCYSMFANCDSDAYPNSVYACRPGLNPFVGNDGQGALGIDGTAEAYFLDEKNQLEWMSLKGLHRTTSILPGTENWAVIDQWSGPVKAPPDTMGGSGFYQHRPTRSTTTPSSRSSASRA